MNRTQETSPLFSGWVESGPEDVIEAEQAVRERDLERLGTVMEHSTMKMVGTMFSAQPAVVYMKPATVAVLHAVSGLRSQGIGAWATMDAGPNVKILCSPEYSRIIVETIKPHCLKTHVLSAGPDAKLI